MTVLGLLGLNCIARGKDLGGHGRITGKKLGLAALDYRRKIGDDSIGLLEKDCF